MVDDGSRLGPDELHGWRNFVEGGRLVGALLDRRLKDGFGLNHAEYGVLRQIADSGRVRMRELAQRVWFSRSRLAHQIDRLVRLGLVAREEDPVRGKTTYALLTPEGERVVALARAEVSGILHEHLFAFLPPETVAALGPGMDAALLHLRDLPECRL
ncbi:MarR family winged helix-turn-helix transcriptional regulator [Streptosporangium saharense]|uniref:MarR family winged helix-turn-helix transcriptional regulator n=1 Tax=Streptosporangium saharense TaxID=1706840 RepID=UPI003442B528